MDGHVVVIGASNVDIKGRGTGSVFSRVKNPGKIEISAGGVGRNIAENLSLLGVPTVLLSAMGHEGLSHLILDSTKGSGVDTSRLLYCDDVHSGIFMAIINPRGESDASVSDMSVLSRITPEYVKSNIDAFERASFLVLDADLPEETLILCLTVAKERGIPVCVEPVSTAKAQVIGSMLSDITMTTPNKEELEVMVDRSIVTEEDIINAGAELLERGVKYVIVTLGAEGVYCVSEEFKGFVPSISTIVVDSVGAGDALVAGVVAGFLNNMSIYESLRLGVASATLTLTTGRAVYPALSMDAARDYMKKIPCTSSKNCD